MLKSVDLENFEPEKIFLILVRCPIVCVYENSNKGRTPRVCANMRYCVYVTVKTRNQGFREIPERRQGFREIPERPVKTRNGRERAPISRFHWPLREFAKSLKLVLGNSRNPYQGSKNTK